MKTLFVSMVLLAGSFAFANQGVRTYQITKSNFATEHLSGPVEGTITVDYDANTVTFTATETKGVCPAVKGKYCTMNYKVNLVPKAIKTVLPITKIESDSCGVFKVTALRDMRPADGILEKITVEDASQITCQTFVKYVERATYTTAFYDMIHGKEVKARSTMDLDVVQNSLKTFAFSEGSFVKGFPALEIPAGGSLKISDSEVSLDIAVSLNCKADELCPMYMPMPIRVTLPIVEKKNDTACYTEITARDENTVITVRDYSYSFCEMVYLHAVHVEYKSHLDKNAPGEESYLREASLYYDFAIKK